jgi:hypothetical protein
MGPRASPPEPSNHGLFAGGISIDDLDLTEPQGLRRRDALPHRFLLREALEWLAMGAPLFWASLRSATGRGRANAGAAVELVRSRFRALGTNLPNASIPN